MTPALDVSWDAVTDATQYFLWQNGPNGESLLRTTVSPNTTNLAFKFVASQASQMSLEVVATDGAGNYATSTISIDSTNPHQPALQIDSTVPAWGSLNVPITTPVQFVYNHAVDAGSLSTNSLGLAKVDPSGGWNPLDITWSVEADGRTVDLIPTGGLLPNSYYISSAFCGIQDMYGNHGNYVSALVSSPQFLTATSSWWGRIGE
jgi:hypothetical protein